VLGDYSVGKTCIIKRYIKNTFDEEYKASIGVDISSHQLQLGSGGVELQIWDMSGQTEFQRMRRRYIAGSDAATLVFDLTCQSSFANIPGWVQEARETIPMLPLALVGNKADRKEERVVSSQQASQLAESKGMLFYVEASAKKGSNVGFLFERLAQGIVDCHRSA
jgi:Ras-related protein Rab-6A